MKDMKISTEGKKDASEYSEVMDREQYPYGLKIHFDEKSYKKLGMDDAPEVGKKFMMMAEVEVCDVQMHKYEGDEKKISMGMQIQAIELKESESESKDIASAMYED